MVRATILGMKILITGANGQLGQAVCRHLSLSHQVIATYRSTLDITNPALVFNKLEQHCPNWVFHLAALTDVDQCQREPALAFQLNMEGTKNVVEQCRHFAIPLLFLSSIAVFDGQKSTPYNENDAPNPLNIYGQSKWAAEQIVATLPEHLIVRSGWLFGGGERDKKFVSKIVSLARSQTTLSVVDDKIGSPTDVDDLSVGLERLILSKKRGVVHLVNAGTPVSRYQLAHHILQFAQLSTTLHAVPSSHFPNLAPRPAMEAAHSLHTDNWLPLWQHSLQNYLCNLLSA